MKFIFLRPSSLLFVSASVNLLGHPWRQLLAPCLSLLLMTGNIKLFQKNQAYSWQPHWHSLWCVLFSSEYINNVSCCYAESKTEAQLCLVLQDKLYVSRNHSCPVTRWTLTLGQNNQNLTSSKLHRKTLIRIVIRKHKWTSEKFYHSLTDLTSIFVE